MTKYIPKFATLILKNLNRWKDSKVSTTDDLCDSLSVLPSSYSLPAPEMIWLLFSIMELRIRQDWARSLLKKALPQAVPPCDEFSGVIDQPVNLSVPNAPDWSAQIECSEPQVGTLTNVKTGEVIFTDVGAVATHPIVNLDCYYFRRWGDRDSVATIRLMELSRFIDENNETLIDYDDVETLQLEGLLESVYYGEKSASKDTLPDAYRMTDKAMEFYPLVSSLLQEWSSPRKRLWASAIANDWERAHEFATQTGDDSLAYITSIRVEDQY